MFFIIILPLSLLMIFLVSVIVLSKMREATIKRRRRGKDLMDQATCQRCGYDLRGLKVPRCPECGALRGFNESAEEMGIEEEVGF